MYSAGSYTCVGLWLAVIGLVLLGGAWESSDSGCWRLAYAGAGLAALVAGVLMIVVRK